MDFKNFNIWKLSSVVISILAVLIFYFYTSGSNKITIQKGDSSEEAALPQGAVGATSQEDQSLPLNKITGERCQNGNKRPFSVMLAADKVARPLSGISQADLVFEMPVITDGITRYMALFQCEEPKEIGSIRSARHDFITIAQSFDAVFAHWGGSKFALDKLQEKVIDNVDALTNPYDAYFRKDIAQAPHNGFTSYERLNNAAEKLGYKKETNFVGYPHIKSVSSKEGNYDINISYPYPFNVKFTYSSQSNSYLRSVGGFKEVDRNTNKQVEVKNVIVMTAVSKQIEGQYNDVEIESSGEAAVYRNGEIIKGSWERKSGKYYFFDSSKKEIELSEGKIWVSVVQPNEAVSIKNL